MSEDPAWYSPEPETAERMRQALARTLHQIADCIDAAPTEQISDIMIQVAPKAAPLFRSARTLFDRPFGE